MALESGPNGRVPGARLGWLVTSSMFYNVRIDQPGQLSGIHVFDLSEDELNRKILDPWHRGSPILTADGTVEPDADTHLRIRRSDRPGSEILSGPHAPRAGTRAAEIAVMEAGDDVTGQYLRGGAGCEAASGGLPPAIALAMRLCAEFPTLARSLESRSHQRAPIEIRDEYDVQYLLLAAFRMFFEDVRDEETMPSHGVTHPRADFLLADEEIFVEAKMVRKGLSAKKLQTELNDDFGNYRAHPKCRIVIAVVYDPTRKLEQARLEKDLTGDRGEGLWVRTIIAQ